jgi:hypothetical protein
VKLVALFQVRSQPLAISGADARARHFPPPWSVEELDACFVVRDNNGQRLLLN